VHYCNITEYILVRCACFLIADKKLTEHGHFAFYFEPVGRPHKFSFRNESGLSPCTLSFTYLSMLIYLLNCVVVFVGVWKAMDARSSRRRHTRDTSKTNECICPPGEVTDATNVKTILKKKLINAFISKKNNKH